MRDLLRLHGETIDKVCNRLCHDRDHHIKTPVWILKQDYPDFAAHYDVIVIFMQQNRIAEQRQDLSELQLHLFDDAYFGISKYQSATKWLKKTKKKRIAVSGWQIVVGVATIAGAFSLYPIVHDAIYNEQQLPTPDSRVQPAQSKTNGTNPDKLAPPAPQPSGQPFSVKKDTSRIFSSSKKMDSLKKQIPVQKTKGDTSPAQKKQAN